MPAENKNHHHHPIHKRHFHWFWPVTIIIFVGVLTVVVLYTKISDEIQEQQSFTTSSILAMHSHKPFTPYYQKIANLCPQGDGNNCCLASVQYMQQHSYQISQYGLCPQNYRPDKVLCTTSVEWCEPVPK